MKKYIALAIVAASLALSALNAHAGFAGYAPYSITNQTVTAPTYVTNIVQFTLPPISFTATATNNVTITTNTIINGIPGTTYQIANTFIYNSGTYGQSFTTNFPTQTINITNITGFQCVPQSKDATNLCLETFN